MRNTSIITSSENIVDSPNKSFPKKISIYQVQVT